MFSEKKVEIIFIKQVAVQKICQKDRYLRSWQSGKNRDLDTFSFKVFPQYNVRCLGCFKIMHYNLTKWRFSKGQKHMVMEARNINFIGILIPDKIWKLERAAENYAQ